MKEYAKPSLTGLGLLRMVTRLSVGDPGSSGGSSDNGVGLGNTGNGDTGSDSGSSGSGHWFGHGHGAPGALI